MWRCDMAIIPKELGCTLWAMSMFQKANGFSKRDGPPEHMQSMRNSRLSKPRSIAYSCTEDFLF